MTISHGGHAEDLKSVLFSLSNDCKEVFKKVFIETFLFPAIGISQIDSAAHRY